MSDLRLAVHRHVLRLSAAFFDRTPLGQLMTRMTNDIESLTELFASGIISLLGDIVRLGLIIVGHETSIIAIYYLYNSKLYEPANIFRLCH